MSVVFEGWWSYVILALVVLCVLHALRTRQHFGWFFLLLFVPLVGVVIYVFYHGANTLPRFRVKLPGVKIPLVEKLNERKIEKAYHESDTLDNRIDYANVLINREQSQQAVELLQVALAGPLAKNVVLLFAAARAYYAQGQIDETVACLKKAEDISNNERLKQRNLLMAICLQDLSKFSEAEHYYQNALTGTMSEESRVRYGLFLQQQGRPQEAIEMMQKVLQNLKTASFTHRREQAEWLKIAKQTIAELSAK
jgi:hypothetical protein